MLLYNPAFDVYHSTFRLLALLEKLESKSIERDRLRIYDYFFQFPFEIPTIRLPPLLASERNQFKEYKHYEEIAEPANLFFRLESIYDNAVNVLTAHAYVKADPEDASKIARTPNPLPEKLALSVHAKVEKSAKVLDFLFQHLQQIPLRGRDGLKHRTQLMPSLYDRN